MRHEKSCGTIIIDQNKVLLIGAKDKNGQIFWSFPKGHQESGETDIETATRETLEEVGLDVEITDRTPIIVSHLIDDGRVVKYIYLFLAKISGGAIQPQTSEVEYWQWVDFDEVAKYLSGHYEKAWREAVKRQLN